MTARRRCPILTGCRLLPWVGARRSERDKEGFMRLGVLAVLLAALAVTAGAEVIDVGPKIGRASCRERV